MNKLLLSLVTCIWIIPAVGLATDYTKVITIKALSDKSQVVPGGKFTLGVFVTLKEGWHIYWKNPGDAGLPTKIVPEETSGFLYEDLVWPVPKRFKQPGGIAGNGYEKEAAFLLPVSVSKSVEKKEYALPIKASWLLCSDSVCVPGAKSITAAVIVGDEEVEAPAQKESFELAHQRSTLSHATGDSGVKAIEHKSGSGDVFQELTITWKDVPSNVEAFLSTKEKGLSVVSVKSQNAESSTQIAFSTPESKQLSGELLLRGEFAGSVRGIVFSLETFSP
jgi:DsbC/DsbD-like thiol-disulfide interchange protein